MGQNRFDVNGDGMDEASQDTQPIQNSQTSQGGEGQDDTIARLKRLEEENEQLKRRVQSAGDSAYARLEKRMREDEAAIRRVAELDGDDEKTIKAKIRKSRESILLERPLSSVEEQTQGAETQRYAPQQQQEQDPRALYMEQMRAYLANLGVKESELGGNGLRDYADPRDQKAFARRVGEIIAEQEQNSAEARRQAERDDFAGQVRQELDDSGGFGGASGGRGGSGAPSQVEAARRAVNEAKKQYLGTGRGHEWLAQKAAILARYGLPPNAPI